MFVFDVICSVAYEVVTSEFQSPFLTSVSVAYITSLHNELKLFKCDTGNRFSTIYHQSLNPQQVFGKCIIHRMAIDGHHWYASIVF